VVEKVQEESYSDADSAYNTFDYEIIDNENDFYSETLLTLNEAFDSPKKEQKKIVNNPFTTKDKDKNPFSLKAKPGVKNPFASPSLHKEPLPKEDNTEKINALTKNLTDMGFNPELASKAVQKAKKLALPDVL
jgi:hypothetical protein